MILSLFRLTETYYAVGWTLDREFQFYFGYFQHSMIIVVITIIIIFCKQLDI